MGNDSLLYTRGTCAALVITCSDFRFKSAEREFLEATGLADDYDLIARPGAIRSLVAPRSTAARATMEEEIALLCTLHAFTRALMVNHLSCRAYDDLTAGRDERSVHMEHLATAGAAIERLLPGVAAEACLVTLAGDALRIERLNA